jgi:Flp pilus assembly protein TadD
MNLWLAAAVFAHIASGILVLLSLRRLVSTWRRREGEGPEGLRTSRALDTHGVPLLLFAAGLTGLLLTIVAAVGQSIGHWRGAYLAHVVSGILLFTLATLFAVQRVGRQLGARGAKLAPPTLAAGAVLAVSGGALAATHYAAESYFSQLTAATPAQAHNPLFPAGTTIQRPADWGDSLATQSCGEPGCHPQIVRDWQESPHARSTSSTEYAAALAGTSRRLRPDGTRWCAGCHAPLSLVARRPHHSDSVDCLSCHAMSAVAEPVGNGRATYAPPPTYPFAHATGTSQRWLRGFLLRVRPAPHRAGMAGPSQDRIGSAMCAPCHRLSVNAPQNGYKFLPYDETWAEWQAGPYSGESAHVFQTAKKASCADCHFIPGRGADPAGPIHSHAGSQPMQEFAKRDVNHIMDSLRVELFGIRRETGPGQPPQFDAPLNAVPVRLVAGETVTFDVLVENRGIGHSFIGGLPSSRSAWLEVRASAITREKETGRPRDGEAHAYGLWALNRNGKQVGRDDFYTMVSPVLLRSIPAGESEVARYRFKVPKGTPFIRLTARLQSESPGYATSAISARLRPRPSLLASDMVQLSVEEPGRGRLAAAQHNVAAVDPQRFYIYGVGLMRPNAGPAELAQARAAFREAIRVRPDKADYLTALARAYLAEGDLLSARAQLEQALTLDRRSPRARAWLGSTLLRMGQLEAALAILNPLSREFPRDGALWIDLGLCQLKSAQYEPASEAFTHALEVDPNDSTAHYNLMRCYTAMNRLTDARREEAIFRALQDDEPLTNLVEPFLQSHPGLRRESNRMHVHPLEVDR